MGRFDDATRPVRRVSQRLAAYARLVRLPNLFTAPPDVLLGLALAAGLGHAVSLEAAVGVTLASVFLYAAGTTLNDYADATEDARLRPERPVPSGDVSRTAALALGVASLGGGVSLAVAAGGSTAGVVAVSLAAAIVLYDGAFKETALGFAVMGASRGLNVLLGAAVAVTPTALPGRVLVVPLLVGCYVAAITYMAESESGEGVPLAVPVAVAGATVAVIGGFLTVVLRSPPFVEAAVATALLLGFAVWTGRALHLAYRDPSPATIGPAVGTCVLALAVFDAALAAPSGVAWSLAAVAFLVPAIGLARYVDVT